MRQIIPWNTKVTVKIKGIPSMLSTPIVLLPFGYWHTALTHLKN
uniref:Uncharacterized protein n=1 Tax=Arundo donax TaxID=35708 RepID=A0A0A9D433_ARUDO